MMHCLNRGDAVKLTQEQIVAARWYVHEWAACHPVTESVLHRSLDAYQRVEELLERWESDRERLESVATWDGCDHDRDLAQDAASTLASWDDLARALYGEETKP
jgi:hypothetical protein